MDLEFPRGRGDQVKKSWKFQGVGGSNLKPSGTENPGGGGSNCKQPSVGGVWIFSGTTQFRLRSKWNTSVQMETLLYSNNVVPCLLISSTGF